MIDIYTTVALTIMISLCDIYQYIAICSSMFADLSCSRPVLLGLSMGRRHSNSLFQGTGCTLFHPSRSLCVHRHSEHSCSLQRRRTTWMNNYTNGVLLHATPQLECTVYMTLHLVWHCVYTMFVLNRAWEVDSEHKSFNATWSSVVATVKTKCV